MATPIKRIEKDFLLKALFDEQLPVLLRSGREEFVVIVERPPKRDLRLKPDRPLRGVKGGQRLDLMFDYRSQTVTFSVLVEDIKDGIIVAEAPEFLYKNLGRSYSRVASPEDMKIAFSFRGERYALSFPRIAEYEPVEPPAYSEDFDPRNIKDLVSQLSSWARDAANGHKLVMFKDASPNSLEERVVAETGKALFIPSTQTDLPQEDPFPKKLIVTEQRFRRFMESSGTDPVFIDDAIARFLKTKLDAGTFSDLWSPILFQEYVIGYIRLWIDAPGKPPFDLSLVETLHQFAKVLAFSLKANNYFKQAELKKSSFQGKIVDISASGLLFAHHQAALASTLLPESEIDLQLSTAKRSVKTPARIVRRYKDASLHYFGCRFVDIAPEDLRFLFEYIYGRPFTDADAGFLAGKV